MSEREYMRADFDGRPPRSAFWAMVPATKALLIGLVAIHVIMAFLRAGSPDAAFAVREAFFLHPEAALKRFHIWQLVTCALFHADLMHLFFNGIMIWFFGSVVEKRLGVKRYLYFCLGTVVTASLAFLLESAILNNVHPMLGASGVALGFVVLVACWHPRMTVLMFFVLPMPLWVVAVLAVVIDLVLMLELPGSIAHSAHLGGAVYGFVYFRYGGRFGRVFDAIDSMAEEKQRRKQERHAALEAELRVEVDRILDKVNREGMAALSKEERRFLKEASEKLRR